jgi:NAD(P)H-flavin reductase
MLVTGIKSRPVYTTLQTDLGGRQHVLIGQGTGGAALIRVLRGLSLHDVTAVIAIYAGEPFKTDLAQLGIRELRLHPTEAESVADLHRTLARCFMGSRVYVAGSESFIGSCVQVTAQYAMNADEVQCEHLGDAARRVYCIHCKTSNENATTKVVPCSGCGRRLLVRDHYSRRLAGFMGVMVDAEAPGEIPPTEATFS